MPARNRIPAQLGEHTIAHQAGALIVGFPDSRVGMRSSRLTWVGALQPSELSRIYTVRIDYRRPIPPKVTILTPHLQPDADGFLPHMYDDDSLCLHDRGQWTARMLIVDTIIPWAAEWLLHYELWLATHTWYGDDHHDARRLLEPVSAASRH